MTHTSVKNNEKNHIIKTLEFFIKNDKKYTTTELKDAGMLIQAKDLLKTEYISREVSEIPVEVPGYVRKQGENSKQYEIVKIYFLTEEGRKYYNQETTKPK